MALGTGFLPLVALGYVLISQVYEVVGVEFSYNPASPLGPQFWPSLFVNDCGQQRQSPIALDKRISHFVRLRPLTFVNYNMVPHSAKIINDGHTAKVTLKFPQAPTIVGGDLPDEYTFMQYHFHWGESSDRGAEHTLEGVRYPLEMHLVHIKSSLINDPDVALQTSDGIAVLGVFFELGKFDNPVLEPVISSLMNIRDTDSELEFDHKFRLLDFLPLDKFSFYRYLGSLTTPNCNEAAVWTVFTSTLPVSERQLSELRKLLDINNDPIVDNFRPIQPLNGRMIYRNGLTNLFNFCFIPFICPLFGNFFKTLLVVLRALVGTPIVIG